MSETGLERPSTAGLLGDALAQTSHLIGSEFKLVRVELNEKIAIAVRAIVALVVAAVFLIVAMIFVLQGVVALLVERGLSSSVSSFTVGGAIAVCALIAIVVASRSLSPSRLRPDKTLRQLQANSALIKDTMP